MKNVWRIMLPALLLVLLLFYCGPALGESGDGTGAAQDEWTVMIYLCGSDLESQYGYATENLDDIFMVHYPYDLNSLFAAKDMEEVSELSLLRSLGKVNILIETGGCKQWHAQKLAMDISSTALQRWRYNYYPETDGKEVVVPGYGIELLETLPLKSMAEPETLTEFIRWGTQTYPAKKYALVLWDHGGGAKTGLFVDELFNGDTMYLYELVQAMDDAGTEFEIAVFDACMMANIETAAIMSEYTRWMVASEEVVPGKGTAIGDWLQALVNHPSLGGEWLGRCICDMTAIKYANGDDEMARALLTWAVIDLSKLERVFNAAGRFFSELANTLVKNPIMAKYYTQFIYRAEEYGDGKQNMRDFGSVIYNENYAYFGDTTVLDEAMDALADAVVYVVRGPGRSEARGLSFCYPADFDDNELNIYAQNFPLASYLAYIDAITPWTAPDWVYRYTERLPEIDTIEELKILVEKCWASSGMPAISLGGTDDNADEIYYCLYRLDEETGDKLLLGRTDCGNEASEEGETLWRASDPFHWPAIDGTLCCINLIQKRDSQRLYNIPVQINSENSTLRCGRLITEEDGKKRLSDYEVFGLWEGYDDNSELMSRSVRSLASLAGREYRLLYPRNIAESNGRTDYSPSRTMTMYRKLDVQEIPLPAGTYYLQYEVTDTFMRTAWLDMIEFHWDGEKMTFPDGFAWEGVVQPVWEQ